MPYTIKQAADMAGVSVRTLHHYDQFGLLNPAETTMTGYRLYGEKEMEKLQQILFFRELDFPLAQIKAILERPDFDREAALHSHRSMLLARRERLDALIENIDKTLGASKGGMEMGSEERFTGFGKRLIEENEAKYGQEIREKYGEEAVQKSYEKVGKYTKEEWEGIQAEADGIYRSIAGMMALPSEDRRVQSAIKQHYDYLNKYFSTYTKAMYMGLGEMYAADERFRAFYEKYAPGMAGYMREAIRIFCL